MKNRKIYNPILIVIMILSLGISATLTYDNQRYSIDTPYQFPLTPDDEDWKNIKTKVEALSYCQIPKKVLKEISTEALLETVLNYPFLLDFFAYNSYKEAADVFEKEFNGFGELFKRKNITEVLNTAYKNIDSGQFIEKSKLEFLLTYNKFANEGYSVEEAKKFYSLI